MEKIYGDAKLLNRLKDLERGKTPVGRWTLSHISDAGLVAIAKCPQMISLEELFLNNPTVTDAGMKALAQSEYLTQLKSIGLYGRRVTIDGVEALLQSKYLIRLQSLRLASRQMSGAGMKALVQSPSLARLRSLEIGFWVTDADVEALAQNPCLKELLTLGLRKTRMTDIGMKALTQSLYLKGLVSLDFRDTWVTDLGIEILAGSQNLAKLRSLNLDGTRITDAGVKALAQSPILSQLHSLRLSKCDVTDSGIEALAQSPHLLRLRRIYLYNTRVTLPEQIIHSGDAVGIFRYFRESRLGGPLLELKVPILGMGAMGKSLLLRHLSGDKGAFQQNNPATPNFEVRNISLNVIHAGQDHRCSVRFFDFGGQPELHGAHRFFLADKYNVYVIVVSARLSREENRLDYWLRMVKYRGGGAPVVVVVSHCDDMPGAVRKHSLARVLPRLDAEELFKEQGLFVQVVDDYSNVDGTKIGQVRRALQRATTQLTLVFTVPFAPGFFSLRNWLVGDGLPPLQNPPAFERYWTVDHDFRAACDGVGQKDSQQQDFWLHLLRDLGYVHFVGDRPKVKRSPENSLSNYLFHPEWVKKPVYNVVRLEARQGGIVSGKQVNAVLQLGDMSDEEIRRLLALMLECALIFQMRGGDPDTPDYLIPDQIGVRPEGISLNWIKEPKEPKPKFRWRFHFLPDHLLAQLVGRWFDDQPKGFTYFRDDVILTMPDVNCRVRLHADFNKHELEVEFDKDRIEPLKTRLEIELQNLLDPEHALRKPPWEEDDLLKPESKNPHLIERIAESLWKLVISKTPKPDDLKNVAVGVTSFFEESNQRKKTLTYTEKLTYRICMLFAFAQAKLVLKNSEAPKPWKECVKDVLYWLNTHGVEIKNCFRAERGFKTLDNEASFSRTYNKAYHKLGKSQASMEDLERLAVPLDEFPEDGDD